MGVIFGRKPGSLIKVAVMGEGPEAERLAAGYRSAKGVELAAFEPSEKAHKIYATQDLKVVEISVHPWKRLTAALSSIQAGFFTSVEPPENTADLHKLREAAEKAQVPLRIRMLPFYYPPYRQLKKLVDEDAVGTPINLKLAVKRGKGSEDCGGGSLADTIHKEIGFLALAPWLMGPAEEVYARHEESPKKSCAPSSVIAWKHCRQHRHGYLQIDFCPGLHVRTRCQPVHRMIQLTGLGGILTATRGEGQLMRMPALMLRGKNATTAFETVVDDWQAVYTNLAEELVMVIMGNKKVLATTKIATDALSILERV